jgi:hypothetical protein
MGLGGLDVPGGGWAGPLEADIIDFGNGYWVKAIDLVFLVAGALLIAFGGVIGLAAGVLLLFAGFAGVAWGWD